MTARETVSAAYGQLRGYGRWHIASAARRALRQSAADVREQQVTLFRRRVLRALGQFPAYAHRVREANGCLPTPESTFFPADLPVWTKEDQRALYASLDASPLPGAILHATGGSSGTPIRFYMTRESYEWRTAVSDRGYGFAGAEPGRRSFYVWSEPIVSPPPLLRLKKRAHLEWFQNRRFFSCFRFSDERKAECCREINRRRPAAIVGFAGALVDLAAFVREHPGLLTWRARSVVTAAEGLQPGQRELLERCLGDEVFMSYGSREFMLIGMESRLHCGYHLSEDNLLVEVVDEQGQPASPGTVGRIVVTDLHNDANPFVRYAIGDLGAMAAADDIPPGGPPFRRLLSVDGRDQEYVLRPDGSRLTATFFIHHLKEYEWIEAYQVAQVAADHLQIRYRSGVLVSPGMHDAVASRLRGTLGSHCRVDLVRVDELTRKSNGKTPVIVPLDASP